MSLIAQHSSASVEHYTPDAVLDAARAMMGGIDLDPASNKLANIRVKASKFFDENTDGLRASWSGRVFLNPPGGKVRKNEKGFWEPVLRGPGRSSAAVWWEKLWTEWYEGRVTEAIFLGFTLEVLRSTQPRAWIGNYPFCVPTERLRFLTFNGENFEEQKSPTHANIITYLPAPIGRARDGGMFRFRDAFSSIGAVRL
jgi:hypothetical protein